MMENEGSPQKSDSAAIRAEFDKILMHHVSSLIDTREDIAALPFNLATIASLLLLADRENEIKSFPESPPERYNRDTFLADIEEIGLDLDEDAISAIQSLEQYGFLVIDSQSQYSARESASLLIMVLDAIFPQMPGMNLVAYVSQAIEEVLTERKEKDLALQSFDQTLEKQGVRLSALSEDKLNSSAARKILEYEAPDPEILQARKTAYLQKLQALRAKSLSSDTAPSVLAGGAQLKHVKIKELFPRNDEALAQETQPEEAPSDDIAQSPDSMPFPDGSMDSENKAFPSTPESPPESQEKTSAAQSFETHPIETQPGLVEPEAPFSESPGTIEGVVPEAEDTVNQLSKEDLIEQKIRQFEEELAMPCPICGAGKVLTNTTEKGKTYYHCSNEECRLISWGKPYNMECPVCKNPFLIEVPEPDGQIGLKCPRATCLFRKKGPLPEISGGSPPPGKRRVAVVKKKRKKGVRRVVRRKS